MRAIGAKLIGIGAVSGLALALSMECAPNTISVEELERIAAAGSGGGGGGATGTGGSGGGGGSTVDAAAGTGGTGGKVDAGGTGGKLGPDAGTGGTGGAVEGPYAPRTGSFKMLAYSKTAAFRHDGSINTGHAMLTQIAAEQGFQIEHTEDNDWLTHINDYEILFFINPTGDIFTDAEQKIFENWMKAGGAWAGTHSATDTENGWAFYSEVTGQYYNGHGAQDVTGHLRFEPTAAKFPAAVGLPNPWQRNEEWYQFNSWQTWIVKPGFMIIARLEESNQPLVFAREWSNFRSFYSAIGHDASVFTDPQVKKHITGGIMWTVRREKLIK